MHGNRHGIFRLTVTVFAFAILIFFFREAAAGVLKISAMGAVLAFLLNPLYKKLETKLPKGVAAAICLFAALIFLAAILLLAVPPLIKQLKNIGNALGSFAEHAKNLYYNAVQRIAQAGISLPELSGAQDIGSIFSGTIAFAGSVAGTISDFVLACALCCFFLTDKENLLLRLELCIPQRWRCDIIHAGNTIRREMYVYIRGQVLISLLVGILAGIMLLIAGVPSAPVLGILIGVLNLIPYLGPVLGGIPAVIMALQTGVDLALITVGILVFVQQIDSLLISPRVMGGLAGLSPVTVLLAIFAGSAISGITGMLAALPVYMVFRTLFRVFVQKSENI